MGLISVRSEVQLLDGPLIQGSRCRTGQLLDGPFGWKRRPRNGLVPVRGLAFGAVIASVRVRARFLACARDGEDEAFNTAFHRWMQRGGQVAALLVRAHSLVRYAEWTTAEVQAAATALAELTANQRKNVLLGTPLDAVVRNPRWAARETLSRIATGVTEASVDG